MTTHPDPNKTIFPNSHSNFGGIPNIVFNTLQPGVLLRMPALIRRNNRLYISRKGNAIREEFWIAQQVTIRFDVCSKASIDWPRFVSFALVIATTFNDPTWLAFYAAKTLIH